MSDDAITGTVLVVAVALFAIFFRDAFMATSEFLDDTRCTIGMKHYCDKE